MRIASIDIGTNTILLLIAEIEQDAGRPVIITIRDEMVVARLGKGVDEHRKIIPATFERVRGFLRAYIGTAKRYYADSLIATGTSALRDAANRDEFLEYIRRETGITIRILSGDEEARYTFLGALSGLPTLQTPCGVIDIGGGSTEIVTGTHEKIDTHLSIDIGSVRLTERYLTSSPPTDEELARAVTAIRSALSSASLPSLAGKPLLGVAGTVTTLAALRLNLPVYDRDKVSGYTMPAETIEEEFTRLRPLTLDQIRAFPQIDAGRADIILAGVLILRECMKALGSDEVITSDRGLRYGVALAEYSKNKGKSKN